MVASNDDLDMPQEWLQAIVWNLANDLETEYPVNDARLATKIERKAGILLGQLSGWDKSPPASSFSRIISGAKAQAGAAGERGPIRSHGPAPGSSMPSRRKSDGDKVDDFAIMAVPGLVRFANISSLPSADSTAWGRSLYGVIGDTLYSIASDGSTERSAPSRQATRAIVDNGAELAIHGGGIIGYVYSGRRRHHPPQSAERVARRLYRRLFRLDHRQFRPVHHFGAQ
jgi:hypothetical protein